MVPLQAINNMYSCAKITPKLLQRVLEGKRMKQMIFFATKIYRRFHFSNTARVKRKKICIGRDHSIITSRRGSCGAWHFVAGGG